MAVAFLSSPQPVPELWPAAQLKHSLQQGEAEAGAEGAEEGREFGREATGIETGTGETGPRRPGV